jgi:chromosome partitioning protein
LQEDRPVWIDVIEKKKTPEQIILPLHPNLHLIPSSLNNSVLDRVLLQGQRNWATAISGPLKTIRAAYDLIVMDTAPNLSLINAAASLASDLVILPITGDAFSLLGLRKHLADLDQLGEEFQKRIPRKILFTRYDGREKVSRKFLEKVHDLHEDILMKNFVRTSSDLKSKVSQSLSIFSQKSSAKEDYDAITRELLGWG